MELPEYILLNLDIVFIIIVSIIAIVAINQLFKNDKTYEKE